MTGGENELDGSSELMCGGVACFAGAFDDVFTGFVRDPGFDFQAMPGAIDGASVRMS